MNKVEEFAKLIDTELDKIFKVLNVHNSKIICTAELSECYGIRVEENFTEEESLAEIERDVLNGLLVGDYIAVKNFIPNYGKVYWTIEKSVDGKLFITSYLFHGTPCDYALLEKGWIFSSAIEASSYIESVEKELKELNKKYGISGN